jgi:hypothetical protein
MFLRHLPNIGSRDHKPLRRWHWHDLVLIAVRRPAMSAHASPNRGPAQLLAGQPIRTLSRRQFRAADLQCWHRGQRQQPGKWWVRLGFLHPTNVLVHHIRLISQCDRQNFQAFCQSGQWQPAQLGQCLSSGSLGTGTLGIGGTNGLTGGGVAPIGGCPPTIAPANGQVQYAGKPGQRQCVLFTASAELCNRPRNACFAFFS